MLIDTHVHFDLVEKNTPLPAVFDRARAAGVGRMIAVGGSVDGNSRALVLAEQFPDEVFAAAGFDRYMAGQDVSLPALEDVIRKSRGVAALGEMGLDYHYSPETKKAQVELFGGMLDMARRLRLPVIVHSREADVDTLALLEEHLRLWPGAPDAAGVLHCFTGDETFANKLVDLGMCISFSGILSFRNADGLRVVARRVPDRQILVETDSPYLAPAPYRGKQNEPAYVKRVAEVLGEVRKQDFDTIARVTTENAMRLFATKPV